MSQIRDDSGPWLPETVDELAPVTEPPEDRDTLYSGIAGLAPVLAEIRLARPLTDGEDALLLAIVGRLQAQAQRRIEPSLYCGLAGDAVALRLLAPGAEVAVIRRLHNLTTPLGWATTLAEDGSDEPYYDLLLGNAGVVLIALWLRGEHWREIVVSGGEALLAVAEVVGDGLDWRMNSRFERKMPNYSHGTAGIATARSRWPVRRWDGKTSRRPRQRALGICWRSAHRIQRDLSYRTPCRCPPAQWTR